MKQPSDAKGLQSFLGMVNYLHRYSPYLLELTVPLSDICKQSSELVCNDGTHAPSIKSKRRYALLIISYIMTRRNH